MIWAWCTAAYAVDLSEGDTVVAGHAFAEHVVVLHDGGDGRVVTSAGEVRLWDQVSGRWMSTVLSGVQATALTAIDIDGDARDDLLIAVGNETRIRTAASGFAETARSPQAISGQPIDVDGDGDLDVVGAHRWFENRLGGSAWLGTVLQSPFVPVASAGGDLDGDGDTDLLATDGEASAWLENDGTGFGWTSHSLPWGGTAIWLLDADSDGDLDGLFQGDRLEIAAVDPSLPELFAAPEVLDPAPPAGEIRVVDIDGTLLILFADGSWTTVVFPLLEPHDDLGWREAVGFGDVDGDGTTDLVAASDTRLEVWTSLLTTPTADTISSEAPVGVRLHPGDVDGDGDQDLVGIGDTAIDWYENVDGNGAVWTTHVVLDGGVLSAGAPSAVVDLDADGDLDLVGYDAETETVVGFLGDGGGGFVRTELLDIPELHDLGAGDLDSDGTIDLVTSSADGLVVWFGSEPVVVDDQSDDVFRELAVFDLDLDGDLDLVAEDGDLSWFDNRAGNGRIWTEVVVDPSPGICGDFEGLDFDRDGDLDLVGTLATADFLLEEATLPLGQAWTDTSWGSVRAADVVVADFDLDGAGDVIGASQIGLVVHDNQTAIGGAPSFVDVVVDPAPGAAVVAVDVDGDGDADVVAHVLASGELRVWRNLALHPPDDTDGDGRPDAVDACPNNYQTDDVDRDGDGLPAACDCNPNDGSVFPGAVETCNGRDNDCNGVVDDGFDVDGDGYTTCGADGAVGSGDDDCDDVDATARPGGQERCDGVDNNCDGVVEPDVDGDGSPGCLECDDSDPAVFPGAPEVPYDGLNNDCDPETPDDDLDADGFLSADDCDDADPLVNPDGVEVVYDGADNDCVASTLDDDLDGDGFVLAEDCDDTDPQRSSGIAEVPYDGIDNDCSAETPDDDADLDGAPVTRDCDDTDPAVGPEAEEVPYDGVDNDCTVGTPDDDLDADGFAHGEDCDDDDAAVGSCPEDEKGCGCATGGPQGVWALLVAVGLIRRRGRPGG